MPLQLLLLLTLLGPGSSVQLGVTPVWRPSTWNEDDFRDEDFDTYAGIENTDPPEMLEDTGTEAMTLSPNLQAVMGTSGQRDSAGPGTPELATLEVHSAGLDAGGAATGSLGTEVMTEGIPITPGPLPTELVTSIPPIMEAPSTDLATVKTLSVGPAATEALTTQPAATEALTTQPAATEALTTQPAATEALTTQPAATEALTTQPAATEALSTEPAATGALSTAAPSTEPTTTETLPKDPASMKALSTRPANTGSQTTALLVPSDRRGGTTVAVSDSSDGFIKQQKNSQRLSPASPVSSSPTSSLGQIPVKHCLLAILILALVATTFLVCTVVLAVRLSRKNHTYPVRSYSPTEMVCISSLLPEGGEGPAVTANGSLPASKKPGLKGGSGEEHDGDDLTLHSFLP